MTRDWRPGEEGVAHGFASGTSGTSGTGEVALLDRIEDLADELRARMRELGVALSRADQRPTAEQATAQADGPAEPHTKAPLDVAQPYLRALERAAAELDARWDAWFEAPKDLADARALVGDTRAHLRGLGGRARSLAAALGELPAAPAAASAQAAPAALLANIERRLAELVAAYADNRSGAKQQ